MDVVMKWEAILFAGGTPAPLRRLDMDVVMKWEGVLFAGGSLLRGDAAAARLPAPLFASKNAPADFNSRAGRPRH